jgi:hypothetical protein
MMNQPPSQTSQFELSPTAQELYVDSVNVGTHLWGSTLYLGKLREANKPLVQAVVKVSPQMLKAIGLIINKHVREYERDIGPIALPKRLLHDMGLEDMV